MSKLSFGDMKELVDQWTGDPQIMLRWQTDTMKYLCLLLRHKVENPAAGRSSEMNQNRAIELLVRLLASMEGIKEQAPIRCPKCDARFTPGEGLPA